MSRRVAFGLDKLESCLDELHLHTYNNVINEVGGIRNWLLSYIWVNLSFLDKLLNLYILTLSVTASPRYRESRGGMNFIPPYFEALEAKLRPPNT